MPLRKLRLDGAACHDGGLVVISALPHLTSLHIGARHTHQVLPASPQSVHGGFLSRGYCLHAKLLSLPRVPSDDTLFGPSLSTASVNSLFGFWDTLHNRSKLTISVAVTTSVSGRRPISSSQGAWSAGNTYYDNYTNNTNTNTSDTHTDANADTDRSSDDEL